MIYSFLLIGQSNMAGRGFLPEATDVNTKSLYVLRNGRFHHLFRPVHNDRSFSGVCLGERFAERVFEAYGVEVGLIPCADGGTALSQWQEGEILFENAVYQATLAKRTSRIAGILWHQGEGDCAPELYATYKERLIPVIRALRRRLDLPDVPFLVGGLGDFLADCPHSELLKNYAHVNEALKKTAQSEPLCAYVSAEGLTSNPDFLHFNARSLYTFGERYADAFLPFGLPKDGGAVEADEKSAMERL
ncbi:MAG: sialate O-acetylesterase [Clostridia bacterium]|nr:sialate O-acetylesterase [Clostridia bacterium]